MRRQRDAGLVRLARLHGVQTRYVDAAGRHRRASVESVLAVLRAIGAPVEKVADVPAALLERERALRASGIQPVLVAWDGKLKSVELRRARPGSDAGAVECRLRLETGETLTRRARLRAGGARTRATGAAAAAPRESVDFGRWTLPPGYHQLELELAGERHEALILAAPSMAYLPEDWRDGSADWGVFLPLYALRTHTSWGAGDLSDLGRLAEWVHGLGGRVVGTLPLLSALLDTPFEPGPYAPASRLFWNELYADPSSAPELEPCVAAREVLASADFAAELDALRAAPLVNYERLAAARRSVLRPLADCFFERGGAESAEYRRFLDERPELEAFARFRATCERRAEPWPAWPARLRDGKLRAGDCDPGTQRYHMYAQWLLHQQLESLASGLRRRGQRLYLDLPLGVHPAGFDVWRWQELFARGVSVGAPPDAFFSLGQNWGFPPLRPEVLRATGYAYTVASLRSSLRYAGMLRMDHVMALHRVFWVPDGMEARDGVYVRHPAEELYAVLCLESLRHRSILVGEDLGTVPDAVRRTMRRHGVQRMWVLEFEASPNEAAVTEPAPDAVASVGTHDTPTFAGFWEALDVADREAMGLLNEGGAAEERARRTALREAMVRLLRREGWIEAPEANAQEVLRACLARMAAGQAGAVLVNLEDLWGETLPQNVPGTGAERPNWRRKARYTFEAFSELPAVTSPLERIQRLRSTERERE